MGNMNEKQKVIEMAKVLFVGANLFSKDAKEISMEETCKKFKAIELPIKVVKRDNKNGRI
jgi:hypothetical protein